MKPHFIYGSRLRSLDGRDTGLTLIEMIVVLAIIALVAALIVPSVINRPDQARVTVARADMKAISTALRMYRLDRGDYPTTEQGLAVLVNSDDTARAGGSVIGDIYLAQMPVDPWGRSYAYRSPGAAGHGFDLLSLGRDGQPGGEGTDTDLVATAGP